MKPCDPRFLSLLLLAVAPACVKHSGDIGSSQPKASPVFVVREEVDVGADRLADYVVANFNGDASLDMAVISLEGELRILTGDGSEQFGGALGEQVESLFGVPAWIDAGDFDGDGDLDLVVVRSADSVTEIWENDNGVFAKETVLPVGADALAMAVGDLDQDGELDIAVALPLAPQIYVAFGEPGLAFSELHPLTLPGGGRPFNLVIGDANRDGQDDVVVADIDNSRVMIYAGTSQANFGSEVCQLDIVGTPGAVTLGDLSGDGNNDLIVSIFDADHYLVITDMLLPAVGGGGGGGGPTVTNCGYMSFAVLLPGRPSLATVADVSGDGINDLVACLAFESNIAVGHGTAGGGIGAVELLDASDFPLRPFAVDNDGNGFNDVFALSGNGDSVNLWHANEDGKLRGARNYASGLLDARLVEGADLDGDGDFEVLAGGNTTSITILGYADGGLAVEDSIAIDSDVKQMKVRDLNADGLPDLILSVAGGVRVIRNRSTPGSYLFEDQPSASLELGAAVVASNFAVAELNADANHDLIACDPNSDTLFVLPGTSDPFVFDAAVPVTVAGAPFAVAAGDFNGDERIDLAVSRSVSSDIAILGNDGAFSFTELMLVPNGSVGDTPTSLLTDDLNGDGSPDLVVTNTASDSVSILFGNDTGFAGIEVLTGVAPIALLARDVTGDGVRDIVVASIEGGDFQVLVGEGDGSFTVQQIYPGTLGTSDAVVQDMTGNGQADLVLTNLLTNRVTLVDNVTPR